MARLNCLRLLTSLVLTMSIGQFAEAQITVNTAYLEFQPGKRPVQNVLVSNSSQAVGYVTVSIEEVIDPEAGGEKVKPADDLLVSPKAFSIEPRGLRTVRLLLKKFPEDKEKVFRVVFSPADRGFGQDFRAELAGRVAVIRVLSGMGMLVFADPVHPRAELKWKRTADSIIFSNSGNIHMQLIEGKSCNPGGQNCQDIGGKRVYGGSEYKVVVPSNTEVTFSQRQGFVGDTSPLVIPPGISSE